MSEAQKEIEKTLSELSKRIDELSDVVKVVTEKIEKTAQERPLLTLGAAFVLGLLIGIAVGAASKSKG